MTQILLTSHAPASMFIFPCDVATQLGQMEVEEHVRVKVFRASFQHKP